MNSSLSPCSLVMHPRPPGSRNPRFTNSAMWAEAKKEELERIETVERTKECGTGEPSGAQGLSLTNIHDLNQEILSFIYNDPAAREVGHCSKGTYEWRSACGKKLLQCLRASSVDVLESAMDRVHLPSVRKITFKAPRNAGTMTEEEGTRLGALFPSELVSLSCRLRDVEDAAICEVASGFPLGLKDLKFAFCGRDASEDAVLTVTESLPESLESLHLRVTQFQIRKAVAWEMAAGIPRGLKRLELVLDGTRMRHDSITTLVRSLPRHLEDLKLWVASCPIKDKGVSGLAAHLPPALRHLDLHLENCEVTGTGVVTLAKALPSTLESLDLWLFHNAVGDKGLRGLGGRLKQLTKLEALHLRLENCNLTPRGLQLLMNSLPPSLKMLALGLDMNMIGDDGMNVIAECLPTKLKTLYLWCDDPMISGGGVRALVRGLPRKLEQLTLGLDWSVCGNLRVAPAFLLPRTLKCLELHFPRSRLTAKGARILTEGLPPGLKKLTLGLALNSIGASGAQIVAQNLPNSLRDLHIDLRCNGVTEEGEKALRSALPKSITNLRLDCEGPALSEADVTGTRRYSEPTAGAEGLEDDQITADFSEEYDIHGQDSDVASE